ncbi:hypothetical protein [Xylanimonas oleitrophica]|uniref:hypothetical protein n=1 Tax=Xylanimonas oleitrophica TaxID=2607479 RepID=UPI0011B4CFEC|nr:hypothetical protein [Xylanimonas oleitrophica]
MLAVLVGAGTAVGYGVGKGTLWVRDVWPDPVPALEASKVAPPLPIDVGGPSRPCAPTSLTMRAVPDNAQVAPGQMVAFAVSVENSGRRPCLVDGSETNRQVIVTDAAGNQVWSSADCSSGSRELLLGPGDVDSRTVRWSGKPSVPGACTRDQQPVPPGEYTASVVMVAIPDAVSEVSTVTVAEEGAEVPGEGEAPAEGAPEGEVSADAGAEGAPEGEAPADAGAGEQPEGEAPVEQPAGEAPPEVPAG